MNLHGYNDYNGPGELVPHNPFAADEGHEETWTVGTWMEVRFKDAVVIKPSYRIRSSMPLMFMSYIQSDSS
jgi:hypothetical protein